MRRRAWLLWLIAAAACATATSSGKKTSLIGQPFHLTAQASSGKAVQIGARPGKVLLVDLWATWCEPCKVSLPFFDRLAREYKDKPFKVYAVSMDEDPKGVAPFLKQLDVSLAPLWNSQGDQTAETLGVLRLPTTFIVDRAGIVRYVHEGFDEGAGQKEQAEVDALLANDE